MFLLGFLLGGLLGTLLGAVGIIFFLGTIGTLVEAGMKEGKKNG